MRLLYTCRAPVVYLPCTCWVQLQALTCVCSVPEEGGCSRLSYR